MRKIRLFYVLIFLFLAGRVSFSADFKLLISYLEGEHSKDSWSRTTTITIDEKVYSYSLEGSGFHSAKNENKNGTFTADQYTKIRTYLLENNMLSNDSLFDEDTKYKSFERFTNTVIKMYIDTNSYTIKFNGDVQNLKDKALYNNSIGLINLITDFIKGE